MKINSNSCEISEISRVIALLFYLCNLQHYYSNSRVGPRAVLELQLVISLLFAFIFLFSVQNLKWYVFKAHDDDDMLGFLEIIAIIVVRLE